MEIVSNIIIYIYDYFFKEEELLPIYAYTEPSNDEIDELINATITEIKFDKELSHLKIRFDNLIKEEEENENDNNENDNDKNNGAIQERIKVLV